MTLSGGLCGPDRNHHKEGPKNNHELSTKFSYNCSNIVVKILEINQPSYGWNIKKDVETETHLRLEVLVDVETETHSRLRKRFRNREFFESLATLWAKFGPSMRT